MMIMEKTKAKKWFVIMTEEEIMGFDDPYERLVYEAIKSYCGNGKFAVDLSIRDIQKRSTIKSTRCISENLQRLIENGKVQQTSTRSRRGGIVPVLKVCPPATVDKDSVSSGYSLKKESVALSTESVSLPRLKVRQSKKEKEKNISLLKAKDKKLWVALETASVTERSKQR